jgi:zinc protease
LYLALERMASQLENPCHLKETQAMPLNSKHRLLKTVSLVALLTLVACRAPESDVTLDPALSLPSIEDVDFAQEASDLAVDADVIYGKLPNGLRYAVRANATPTETASLLMRFDTGSLNETDETRGIAHFLEHMAFNGSENVPEGEMLKRLERFGLSFGADTNASTGFEETIYQMELPDVSEEILDETLYIMRETADRLSLDPEAIEKERGVIQAERRARNTPGLKALVDRIEFYAGDTLLPDRLPIGTAETIDSVTPEQFRAYYDGYYRPENTFVTLVGDFDPSFAAQKIEEYFGDWEATEGVAALESVEIDAEEITVPRASVYTDPDVRTSLSLAVMRDLEERPDTVANRKRALIDYFGNAMLNRRLGKMARTETSAFTGASASTSNFFDATEISSLNMGGQPENWEAMLAQGEQALRQALEYGFSQAELDEQVANYENSLKVAVQTANTRRTPNLARGILNSFGGEQVVTTPQSSLDRFLAAKPDMTLEAVEAAFREQWAGIDTAPQLYLQTPDVIEGGEAKLLAALEASRAVAVEPRAEEAKLEFAYTDFGTPGQVVKTERLEDLDATLVTFDNGVRLNLKKTPYEENVVRLSARVGAGSLAAPVATSGGFEFWAPYILEFSGLAEHKVDDIATITAGRTVGVNRGFGSTAMIVSGSTVPEDLELQLQLMTAAATDPTYRPEAKSQYEKLVRSWYPTIDSTPGGVAARDIPRILRSGDKRWGYPTEPEMLDVDEELMLDWMAKNVSNGAIELTAVGDFDADALIALVGKTFGALPDRKVAPYEPAASVTKLDFPDGTKRPIVLNHAGDPETASLRLYYPAPDASDLRTDRAMTLLRDMLQLRMTEVMREEEGATYSPGVGQYNSRLYPGYGYVSAVMEVKPEDIDVTAEKIRAVASEFAAGKMDADMFERARKPLLENLETSLENNGTWMNVLSRAQTDPVIVERFRTRDEMYQNLTLEEVKALAETLFQSDTAVEIHILPET